MASPDVREHEPRAVLPERPCPNCGQELRRVRRRLIDRFASGWRPVRRYRCRNPLCNWAGNLRVVVLTDISAFREPPP